MKKIFITIGILLFMTAPALAIDVEDLYERGIMKESEWREHEARSESYFRARHPIVYQNYDYNYRDSGCKSYNYRHKNSTRYDRKYYDGCRNGDDRGYRGYKKYDSGHGYGKKHYR